MTYAAPSFDYYDDGLVHSHDWSRSTPPGQNHKDATRTHGSRHDQQDGKSRQGTPAR